MTFHRLSTDSEETIETLEGPAWECLACGQVTMGHQVACPRDEGGCGLRETERKLVQEQAWWWRFCQPGYLPTSEPLGPFASQEAALVAARAEANLCPHGIDQEASVCEDCEAPSLWILQAADGRCLVYSMAADPLSRAPVSAWGSEQAAQAMLDSLPSLERSKLRVQKMPDWQARRWGMPEPAERGETEHFSKHIEETCVCLSCARGQRIKVLEAEIEALRAQLNRNKN